MLVDTHLGVKVPVLCIAVRIKTNKQTNKRGNLAQSINFFRFDASRATQRTKRHHHAEHANVTWRSSHIMSQSVKSDQKYIQLNVFQFFLISL